MATESVVELATALVRLIGVQAEERQTIEAAVTERFHRQIDAQIRKLTARSHAKRERPSAPRQRP